MIFDFVALDGRGEKLRESIDAADLAAAQNELLQRGLFLLSIEPGRAKSRLAAVAERVPDIGNRAAPAARCRLSELALFTRQMSMMLRAGASVVPALRAIQDQSARPRWKTIVGELADRVEAGAALRDAMARAPRIFSGQVRSLIGAGEATGTLADAFARAATMLAAKVRGRRAVISALAYPAVLTFMSIAVLITMTLFVLPRFAQLFAMLDTPLPWVTRFMLDTSASLKEYWMLILPAPILLALAAWLWLRSSIGRAVVGVALVRVPLIGRVLRGIILAQLLQLWAALLRSRVPLLEAVQQTREASSNPLFRQLVADIEQAVVEGRSLPLVLKRSGLVPPPVIAAVATGEESGRLGESMEFVGAWLEEENETLLATLTRTIEPAILIVMGALVGGVAVALFLPLFDVATAAG